MTTRPAIEAVEAASAQQSAPLRRFVVHSRGRYDLVRVELVACITATSGLGVTLHTATRPWRMRASLSDLERRLDPRRFLRVHRAAIANLAFVERVRFDAGQGTLLLRKPELRIPVGRDRIAPLRVALQTSASPLGVGSAWSQPAAEVRPTNVRLAVRSRQEVELLDTASVEFVTIDGNYTVFHCAAGAVRARGALSLLESKLRSWEFARINRSVLVNLNCVVTVAIDVHSDHSLVLASGTRLRVGRRFRDRLSPLLEGVV